MIGKDAHGNDLLELKDAGGNVRVILSAAADGPSVLLVGQEHSWFEISISGGMPRVVIRRAGGTEAVLVAAGRTGTSFIAYNRDQLPLVHVECDTDADTAEAMLLKSGQPVRYVTNR